MCEKGLLAYCTQLEKNKSKLENKGQNNHFGENLRIALNNLPSPSGECWEGVVMSAGWEGVVMSAVGVLLLYRCWVGVRVN